jgi:hypothetical protein
MDSATRKCTHQTSANCVHCQNDTPQQTKDAMIHATLECTKRPGVNQRLSVSKLGASAAVERSALAINMSLSSKLKCSDGSAAFSCRLPRREGLTKSCMKESSDQINASIIGAGVVSQESGHDVEEISRGDETGSEQFSIGERQRSTLAILLRASEVIRSVGDQRSLQRRDALVPATNIWRAADSSDVNDDVGLDEPETTFPAGRPLRVLAFRRSLQQSNLRPCNE